MSEPSASPSPELKTQGERRIWKFPLQIKNGDESQVILMPQGALILSVQSRGDNYPCLLAMVNPKASVQPRTFWMFETGETIRSGKSGLTAFGYLGTASWMNYTLHIFEEFAVQVKNEKTKSITGSKPTA